MTDFQFLNADRSIDVIVRTDFINFGSWVGNLTVHQKDNVTTDAEKKMFANIQRTKTTIAELVAFAAANSLSIIAIPIGKPVNALPVSLGLAAVTNLTATPAPTSITLNWTRVQGATQYQIDRATNVGFTTGVLLNWSAVTNPTFADTGLPNNSQYFYRVRPIAGTVAGPNAAINATTTA